MESNLDEVFLQIKTLLTNYEDYFVSQKVKANKPQYHLWSQKPVEIAGKKKNKVYFSGAIQHKSFVGFYFMPMYVEPEKMKKVISSNLLSKLKGKSCFHIKEINLKLNKEIKQALSAGFKEYQLKAWV